MNSARSVGSKTDIPSVFMTNDRPTKCRIPKNVIILVYSFFATLGQEEVEVEESGLSSNVNRVFVCE